MLNRRSSESVRIFILSMKTEIDRRNGRTANGMGFATLCSSGNLNQVFPLARAPCSAGFNFGETQSEREGFLKFVQKGISQFFLYRRVGDNAPYHNMALESQGKVGRLVLKPPQQIPCFAPVAVMPSIRRFFSPRNSSIQTAQPIFQISSRIIEKNSSRICFVCRLLGSQ